MVGGKIVVIGRVVGHGFWPLFLSVAILDSAMRGRNQMTEYHIFWIVSIFLGLLSATVVVGVGCWLMRRVVEDLSNSTLVCSYVLRAFRLAPGGAIVVFGCWLIWRFVDQILHLKL